MAEAPETVDVETMSLAPRKSTRAHLGQRNGIAFAPNVQRISIDLIKEQMAHQQQVQTQRALV